jgi:valyl-tRNA synthetase
VIDPLELMNELGTDALRFTLLVGSTPGNDMNLSVKKVEANRNFANKIWNAARFVISNLEVGSWKLEIGEILSQLESPASNFQHLTSNLHLPDRWILSRLNSTVASVTRLLDNYEFGEAGRQAYEFLWGEYADWYIEMSKIPLNSGDKAAQARTAAVLVHVLDQTLRLLHPYIPYVTEEIWQNLKAAIDNTSWGEALIIAEWPRPGPIDLQAEADMNLLTDAVRAIRNARAERSVEAGKKLAVMIASAGQAGLFESLRSELAFLARLDPDALYVADRLTAEPQGALPIVTGSSTIYLPLAQMIDLAAGRQRLGQEQKDVNAQIERITRLLGSDFATKAPANVVQKERDRLADLQVKAEKLREQIERLR